MSPVYTCAVRHRWRRQVDYTEDVKEEEEEPIPFSLKSSEAFLSDCVVEALRDVKHGGQVVLTVEIARHLTSGVDSDGVNSAGVENRSGSDMAIAKRRMSKAERKRMKKSGDVGSVVVDSSLQADQGSGTLESVSNGGAGVVLQKEDEDNFLIATPLDRLCSYYEALESLRR